MAAALPLRGWDGQQSLQGHIVLGAPSPPTSIYAGRGAQGSCREQEQSCLHSPADVGQRKAVLSYFGHSSNNPK